MPMDWNDWIGEHEDDPHLDIVLLPWEDAPMAPPPIPEETQKSVVEKNLELERRINELMKDTVELPATKELSDYPDKIDMDPVLIEGLFRKGRKGVLTADSKAGKSFFVIELAICVAAGRPFLGRKCEKSKVCYFNFEIEEKECMQRVKDVSAALGIPESEFRDNLKFVHMRGLSLPLKTMKGGLIALILREELETGEPFSLVILDPIYKITAGDENSARDVGIFCNDLDRIAKETGCSIFYTHHHAKGEQGTKKAMDRGSGSGVFARDPDLMIDLTNLQIDGQTRAALMNSSMCKFWSKKLDEVAPDWRSSCSEADKRSSGMLAALFQTCANIDPARVSIMVMDEQARFEKELNKLRAFRMEFVVRSFDCPQPQNVTFSHPIHRLDDSGALVMAEPESYQAAQIKKDTPSVKEQKMDIFVETVDQLILSSAEGYTTYAEVAEALDLDPKTVTRRLKNLVDRYEIESKRGAGNVAKIRFKTDNFED